MVEQFQLQNSRIFIEKHKKMACGMPICKKTVPYLFLSLFISVIKLLRFCIQKKSLDRPNYVLYLLICT